MFFVHADRADLSAPLVRMVCQLCGEMTDPGDLAQARHLLVCRRASEELREAAREAERRSLSPSLDLRGRQCGHLTIIRETKRTIVIRGYCVRTWLARCACTRQFLVRTGALLFDGVDRCPSCAKAARVAQLRREAAAVPGNDHWSRKERSRLMREADALEATLPKAEIPQAIDLDPPPVQVRPPDSPPEKKPGFSPEQIEKAHAARRERARLRREGKLPAVRRKAPPPPPPPDQVLRIELAVDVALLQLLRDLGLLRRDR